jgi:hypothetical protein
MTIPSKLGSNCATGSRQDGFYVNFPQQNIYNIVLGIRGKQKSHELMQIGEKRRKIRKAKYNNTLKLLGRSKRFLRFAY